MAEGSRYQDKTERHGMWKVRLKYAAGIVALAFTVLLALFLPGWYSGWRETEAMEQVVLEKREELRLIDMETLDIGTKLAMLSESEEFSYSVSVDMTDSAETDQQYQEILDEKFSEWYSCHLLPEHPFPISYKDKGEDLTWGVSLDTYVKIDAGVIPVRALVRINNAEDAIEIAILDQSNDFLYYAGIISDEMLLYSFQVLGVESEDELDQKLWDGTYSLDMVRDPFWYDYASVCGANSQEIETTDPTGIFQRVTLRYEEFDVSAFRTMFQSDWGIGLQTMFGTQKWEEIAVSIATMYTGYAVAPVSEEEWFDTWNEEMIDHVRGDLLIIREDGTDTAMVQEKVTGPSAVYGKDFADPIVPDDAGEQAEWADGEENDWQAAQDAELMKKYGLEPAEEAAAAYEGE